MELTTLQPNHQAHAITKLDTVAYQYRAIARNLVCYLFA